MVYLWLAHSNMMDVLEPGWSRLFNENSLIMNLRLRQWRSLCSNSQGEQAQMLDLEREEH